MIPNYTALVVKRAQFFLRKIIMHKILFFWGVGALSLFLTPLLYAPIVGGSSTSGLQISDGAILRASQPLDCGGIQILLGNDAANTRSTKNARLEGASINRARLVIAFDDGTTKSLLSGSIVKAQPTGGVFASYLDLDGKTATLNSSLEFNTDLWPYNGTLNLNNNTVKLNGPSAVTEELTFVDALGLNINNVITLTDTWTFAGNGAIAGNGGTLDLAGGGALFLHPNTELSINNCLVKGLGSGSIILSDKTSQLRLSNMQLELNDDYTFTTGGMYVDGPTTIITADHILTLDAAASMTVDGVSLFYDTLSFADQQNIAPSLGADANHKNCIALNNGVIRHVSAPTSGDVHYTQNAILSELVVAHPYRRLLFDQTVTLDGQGFPVLFTQSSVPLISVAANRTLTLQNITLEYFSPSFVTLASGASLYCNDATRINLAKDEDLTQTFTFRGACTINGQGHALNLADAGGLMVMGHKSSLLLENMTLKGLSGNQLRCMDNTCTVSLNNVKFELDGTYSLTNGSFVILR